MSIKNTLQSNALVMGLYDKLLPYYCRLRPESAVKMVYRQTFGREINLDDPHDLNEKINCLKLIYKDDPLVIRCADKYAVRAYLTEQGFGDYLNDAELLTSVTHSYAMENAHPQLKSIAAHIAPSNDEDGVMRVIKETFHL